MSDGKKFSRRPSFVLKNHESVSYTISTWGGGSGRGNMENRNIEVTYDALRKRIAELEAALSSIARNTCCDKCQEAALVARAALEGGKNEC